MGNVDSTLHVFEKLTTGEKKDLFQRILLGNVPLSGDAIKVYRRVRKDTLHVRKDMVAAKANFRRLSKFIHPDKWKDRRATEIFQMMNGCFDKIEDHKLQMFTFLETPPHIPYLYHDSPGPWEKMWNKTLDACLEDQDNEERDAEDVAEYIIWEACKLACEDSVPDCHVRMEKGAEGYFEALDACDARRAINIVSMLRGKISRRPKSKCPYELIREAIDSQRSSCMYNRRKDANPDYTLDEFYKEFPSMRPAWWPRGTSESGAKKEPPGAPSSRTMPAPVKSFKPRSFSEWMDGRKQVEREHGNQTKRRRGGGGHRAAAGGGGRERASALRRKAPRKKRGCIFVDDEAEDEDEDEEEEDEGDEDEDDEDNEDEDEEEEEEEEMAREPPVRRRLHKVGRPPPPVTRASPARTESTCSSTPTSTGNATSKGKASVMRNADIRSFFVRRPTVT
eukprot:jgi/Mesvir1/18222/Mv09501-RA.1